MRSDKDVRWSERKAGASGVLLGTSGYLLEQLPDDGSAIDSALDYVSRPGYVVGGLMLGASIVHNRWYFSEKQTLLRKLGEGGWINQLDLRNYAGASAIYQDAGYLRPDLPARHGRLRRRHDPRNYAFDLGALVSGERNVRGKHIYSPHGRSIALVGPSGSGKSQKLLNLILDFPGAQLITSTKTELWEATAALRAQLGRVWLFNPSGLGGVESTFSWDPVSGCKDQAIADRRAWALVRGGGGADGISRSDFWAGKAQEILRCYLLAAALADYDIRAVHYWATNPDDPTPVNILENASSMHVPSGWIGTLRSSLDASHNTRTGYFATVVSCVGFVDNPIVAAACTPRAADNFDIKEFLASGTLYAVGSETDKRLAPLLTALTEFIYDSIKKEAAKCPGGRLPLGVAMMLDEVTQQTPVPLDKWSADSRGANITIVAMLQAWAQLAVTWGQDAAKVIEECLLTKILLGRISDPQDRQRMASLAGTREVPRTSEGSSSSSTGSRSSSRNTQYVKEAVLAPEVLYGLPRSYAYIVGLDGPNAGVVYQEPGRKRVKREMRKLAAKRVPAPVLERMESAPAGVPA